MNLINLDKFYQAICDECVIEEGKFKEIDDSVETYLENMLQQTELTLYCPEEANEFGHLLDKFLQTDSVKVKNYCLKMFMRELVEVENSTEKEMEADDKMQSIVPTFRYNF